MSVAPSLLTCVAEHRMRITTINWYARESIHGDESKSVTSYQTTGWCRVNLANTFFDTVKEGQGANIRYYSY